MMLDTVVTFKDLLILAVGIAVIVLLIELIKLTVTLNKTLKKTGGVLDDTRVITTIAAEKAQMIDTAVDDAAGIITNISDTIKGRQGVINSIGCVAAAVGAVRELLIDLGIINAKSKDEPQASAVTMDGEMADDITE